MSEKFICQRQEECPVVLAACELKVKAESDARLAAAQLSDAQAEFEAKKPLMNELFTAGVAMRKAQREYFKDRTHERLVKSKVAEERFDRALVRCRTAGKTVQPNLI
jgi:hypothetical protein